MMRARSVAMALALLAVCALYGAVLAGHVGAQESRAIEGGARESEHGAAALAPPARVQWSEAGSVLDRTRLLTAALRRAVSVADGHSPVGHCRHAGPRIEGGDRWARCGARMRAFARLFVEAAAIHHVDEWLLAAQASRESGLNPWAEGAAGEVGLMQLHPRGVGYELARWYARPGTRARCEGRVDACQRPVIDRGAAALRRAIERCGDEPSALGAYNRGRCGATSYSERVLRRREQLHTWAREAAEGPRPEDES